MQLIKTFLLYEPKIRGKSARIILMLILAIIDFLLQILFKYYIT